MQNLCIAYRSILAKHTLYATGTTGRLIEEVTNLNIHKFLAGHIGGEEQLGAMIDQNQIDLVIFFRDPLNARSNEPDVNKAIRLCDIHNVPLATNIASAEMLLKSLEDVYKRQTLCRQHGADTGGGFPCRTAGRQ